MLKIRIADANTSKREKDANGYLIVKDNPIAKAGVFDYLLSEVFSQVKEEEDRIVKVCRTFADLDKKKELFKGKPIKHDHFWVGKEGETQTADGAIYGDVRADEPYLKADLIIYNAELIEKIENGEVVELSPAYEADIVDKGGSYNGESFEYEQKLKAVNHLAVVETGRSGNDLKIYDKKGEVMKKKLKIKDSLIKKLLATFKDADVEMDTEKNEDSISEVIEKISNIAGGESSDDEKLEAIVEIIKGLQTTEDEDIQEGNQNEPKQEDEDIQEGNQNEPKQEDEDEPTEEGISLTSEELVELIEKVSDSKIKKLQDSMKKEAQEVAKAYKDVSSALGTSFDFANKTADSIYKFGYEAIAKQKLADSMDSKTAFYAVAQVKQGASKPIQKMEDSSTNSKLDELIKLHTK